MVEKQIDKVEDKLEKKFEKNLEKIECTKKKSSYKHLIKMLLCDPHIQFAGSTAYGSFYSQTVQTVAPSQPFVFEYQDNKHNLGFTPNTTDITILQSGIYVFKLTVQTDQPCQITIFVNGAPLPQTTTAANSGAHILTLSQTLALNKNDIVQVRNYQSTIPVTTALPAAGTIQASQNLDLTLFRIAVLPQAEYKYTCKECLKYKELTESSDDCEKSDCHKSEHSKSDCEKSEHSKSDKCYPNSECSDKSPKHDKHKEHKGKPEYSDNDNYFTEYTESDSSSDEKEKKHKKNKCKKGSKKGSKKEKCSKKGKHNKDKKNKKHC